MVRAPGSREDGSEDENTGSGRGVVNADDGSGDVESVKKVAQGSKKPSSAFSSLDVPEDARRMFALIDAYVPPDTHHPTPLKPFVPDYVPAVGGIDEFVKIPRPDGFDSALGISHLDEPSVSQSNKTTLSLQLRHALKNSGVYVPETDIDDDSQIVHRPDRNPGKLTAWMETVSALHLRNGGSNNLSGASQSITYSRNMPDVETLAGNNWQGDMETVLKTVRNTETPLKSRAETLCVAMGVPVDDGNAVEAIHVLLSTFLRLKTASRSNTLVMG